MMEMDTIDINGQVIGLQLLSPLYLPVSPFLCFSEDDNQEPARSASNASTSASVATVEGS